VVSGGVGTLEYVAQVLLKAIIYAVFGRKCFPIWGMHRARYGGTCAKKGLSVRLLRCLYELLFKSPACSIKRVCALLFCVAATGFGSSQSFFGLDIYFHK